MMRVSKEKSGEDRQRQKKMGARPKGSITTTKEGRGVIISFEQIRERPYCWRNPFVFVIIRNTNDRTQSPIIYRWKQKNKGDILMVPASVIDRADTAFYMLGSKHYRAAHYCAGEAIKEDEDVFLWASACAVLYIRASDNRPTLRVF